MAVYESGTGTRGRGRGDACVGTWDLRTSSMGRGDVWGEDMGTSNTGTTMIIEKVGGKCGYQSLSS